MAQANERIPTGIVGLDEILKDGLIRGRAYLVRGGPGTGKTILGYHFLLTGVEAGEPVLFISFSEPEALLRANATSLGLDLEDVDILDITLSPDFFTDTQSYDIFSPSEVERKPTAEMIIERVETLEPRRIFLDGVQQLRYLTSNDEEFRRYAFSLLRSLTERGATVIFSSEHGETISDEDLQFLSDGVIELTRQVGHRQVYVSKFRGSDFNAGLHAMRIDGEGMHVYPQLVPTIHPLEFVPEVIPSGVPGLDEMLHGGVERGTVTLFTGPVGSGKTTVGLQFVSEVVKRNERAVVYLFEESKATLVHRCEQQGIPVTAMQEQGLLALVPIEPLKLTAEEFAQTVRREVEDSNTRLVMIDSARGYQLSVRGQAMVMHLHGLTRYLRNMDITTLLINQTENITSLTQVTELGFSYLADNIIFFRYLEREGRFHKAIAVLKKRVSGFDNALHELVIGDNGIRIGPALSDAGTSSGGLE